MVIFLTCLFIVLMLVLAVKMTAEQHQAIYNVVTTLAVVAMITVATVYFGICLSRCWDICSTYLSTGVVGAAIPARLSRGISECSYGLSETSRGWMPKSRRVYKSRLAKIRRDIDALEIAEGLADVGAVESDCNEDCVAIRAREDQEWNLWSEWRHAWMMASRVARTEANIAWRLRRENIQFCKQIEIATLWHNHELGGE